ncbi:MAG: hypothetical protein JRG76_15150 [Deltaproteobacteria bacterium]|nr:hypothetical protein [Deltaproteobacteria bacterium]
MPSAPTWPKFASSGSSVLSSIAASCTRVNRSGAWPFSSESSVRCRVTSSLAKTILDWLAESPAMSSISSARSVIASLASPASPIVRSRVALTSSPDASRSSRASRSDCTFSSSRATSARSSLAWAASSLPSISPTRASVSVSADFAASIW